MSQITYTDIEATLKGFSIEITASAPDEREKTISVPCEDIKELFGMNHVKWFNERGDDSESLWMLFNAVNGIHIN